MKIGQWIGILGLIILFVFAFFNINFDDLNFRSNVPSYIAMLSSVIGILLIYLTRRTSDSKRILAAKIVLTIIAILLLLGVISKFLPRDPVDASIMSLISSVGICGALLYTIYKLKNDVRK